jgi:uncharacterized membrane protein
MTPIAIVLVVLSAAMHASRNYFTKKAACKQAFVWCYEIVGLILFTPLFLFHCSALLLIEMHAWGIIMFSGVLHFVYWVFLSNALDRGDLSLVYPIMRSSPALVLLFSVVVLKEDVSFKGVAGILLVVMGSYCINMQKLSIDSTLRPMRTLWTDGAIRFAFLTLLTVSGYSIVDKVAVGTIHPVVFAFLYPWISMMLFSAYLGVGKKWRRIKTEWRTNRPAVLVCGVLSIFGYFLILVAFTHARVSYVVGLRQLSIVFAVLLGSYALKEKYQALRLTSAFVIFVGTFLIATG